MSAVELVIKKGAEVKKQRKQTKASAKVCGCWGCKDEAVMNGMCWYHYQEEHYLSK